MTKRIFILCWVLLTPIYLTAQTKSDLKVIVLDENEKEPVPAAYITWRNNNYVTSANGICYLPIGTKRRSIKLSIQSIGYKNINNHQYSISPNKRILTILLEPDYNLMDEVVVVDQKRSTSVVQQAVTIKAEDLQVQGAKTIGKLLESVPGVSSISSGATVSKPVIQGLHSSRILMVNNGVKLESQGWGSDHAPEIDHTGAGLVEVIKGAESIRYGSGALGGVVLFNAAPLLRGTHTFQYGGNVTSGFESNGFGYDLSGTLEGAYKGFALRAHGLWKDKGDYYTANYILANTGHKEHSYTITSGYTTDALKVKLLYTMFYTKNGTFYGSHVAGLQELLERFEIGRPIFPNGAQPKFSRKIMAPSQESTHHTVKAETNWIINQRNTVDLNFAWQYNHRNEYERRRQDSHLPVMNLHLSSYSADAFWLHKWERKGWETQLGATSMYQVNRNEPGTKTTPFIPNYASLSAGGYAIQKVRWNTLALEGGLRYDWRITDAAGYNWKRELYGGTKKYSNLTGSLAAFWNIRENLELRANMGLAWRAPDVNELYSNGLHHGGSWSLGNENLKSERGYKAVLGGKYRLEWLVIEPSVFYQKIDNYIYDCRPAGTETRDWILISWNGYYPIFQFRQDNARFWGGDMVMTFQPLEELNIIAKGEWIRGKDTTRDTWLPYIPSDRYTLSPSWHKHWNNDLETSITVEGLFVTKQTRFDPEKDFVPKTPDAYFLLGASIEAKYTVFNRHQLRMVIAAENLLNNEYKEYTDRFRYFAHAPGRNISVRVIYTF